MNTARWITHFTENTRLNTALPLPPPPVPALQAAHRKIAESLAIFQLGESGGGTRLLRWQAQCAALRHVSGLEEALRAFIAEEQGHAALLVRVLEQLRQPLVEKQWTNSVFRWLRNAVNLEFNMQVLLTAELIAEVYYGLLYLRCSHPAVRAASAKILRDEMQHLKFQREFLTERLRRSRPLHLRLWKLQFRLIHCITSRVVAWDHRHCLRALGLSSANFIKRSAATRRHFERRLDVMLEAAGQTASSPERSPISSTQNA